MSPRAGAARPSSEAEMVARVARACERDGYRTYVNPDGADYFDLVVRRGEEVGLVEAKRGDARAVLLQALRRRAWGDWVAVVLPTRRLADAVVRRTERHRAGGVGVWVLLGEEREVVRAARPAPPDDPFADTRRRFRALLDGLDRGEVPAGLAWDGLGRAIVRASGGRGFREWRLDERDPTDR